MLLALLLSLFLAAMNVGMGALSRYITFTSSLSNETSMRIPAAFLVWMTLSSYMLVFWPAYFVLCRFCRADQVKKQQCCEWKRVSVLSVLFFGSYFSWYKALQLVPVSINQPIANLSPIVAFVIQCCMLPARSDNCVLTEQQQLQAKTQEKKKHIGVVVSIVLSVLGVVLVTLYGSTTYTADTNPGNKEKLHVDGWFIVGVLLSIASFTFFTFYTALYKKWWCNSSSTTIPNNVLMGQNATLAGTNSVDLQVNMEEQQQPEKRRETNKKEQWEQVANSARLLASIGTLVFGLGFVLVLILHFARLEIVVLTGDVTEDPRHAYVQWGLTALNIVVDWLFNIVLFAAVFLASPLVVSMGMLTTIPFSFVVDYWLFPSLVTQGGGAAFQGPRAGSVAGCVLIVVSMLVFFGTTWYHERECQEEKPLQQKNKMCFLPMHVNSWLHSMMLVAAT